jgi:hypothetical protein
VVAQGRKVKQREAYVSTKYPKKGENTRISFTDVDESWSVNSSFPTGQRPPPSHRLERWHHARWAVSWRAVPLRHFEDPLEGPKMAPFRWCLVHLTIIKNEHKWRLRSQNGVVEQWSGIEFGGAYAVPWS